MATVVQVCHFSDHFQNFNIISHILIILFFLFDNAAIPCLTDLDCPNNFYCQEKFCAPVVWKYPEIRRSKKYIKVTFLWFYISILFQHFIRKKIFHLFLFICLLLSDLKFLFICPFCILLVWFVNYTLCQLFLSFSIKPINAIYIWKTKYFYFLFCFFVT
jgi:hypothetical protein